VTVRTIEYLLDKFGAGKSPGSSEYVDLIDTLADDRNAVYFSGTAPEDTEANPLWFNTTTNVLSVYDGEWFTASGATGQGVPVGGTAGQVLSKIDATNYNTQWVAQSALPTPNFVTGRYYAYVNGGGGTFSPTANSTHYMPLYIPTTATFDRIAIRASASFTGSHTIRLGIYNNTNGLPSTVLLDAGTVNATAISTTYEITISQTLTAGWYWLATNHVSASPPSNGYSTTGNTNWLATSALGMSSALSSITYYTQSVNVSGGFGTASPNAVSTVNGWLSALRKAA